MPRRWETGVLVAALTGVAATIRPPYRRLLTLAILVVGASAFSWSFHYQLSQIPPANYEARDDAIITLSHARNLVEYGFIGVSPSGERLEGFSAPLQFWTAVMAYVVTQFDYKTFCRWQYEIGTLALGLVFSGLLLSGGTATDPRAWRYLFVAIATLASAALLGSSRAFLLWHASGMENVYKDVSLIALLWCLDSMLRTGRVGWTGVLLVLVASLARIDGIVTVSILLATFAGLWWFRFRDGRALVFTLIALAPWALYMSWRRLYFGQWEPNTALAQGISMTDRLAAAVQAPADALAEYYQWFVNVGESLQAFQLVWLFVIAWLMRRHRGGLERCALVLAGVLACLARYALFGPARMDAARTVTELAVFSTALVPFVLLGRPKFRFRDACIGTAIVACSVSIAVSRAPDRQEVGWGTEWFEVNATKAQDIAREHDIPRPTLASPDLGAISWRKQFNVIDLGRLGSQVTARVDSPVRYLSEVGKPDIIEIHDSWSCRYSDLFTTREFIEDYMPVEAVRTEWLAAHCDNAPEALSGFWVRRAVIRESESAERRFLDAFARHLDPGLVRAELARCRQNPGTRPCGYVGRGLFRFVPELKADGHYAEVASLLASDPRLAVEHAYFVSSIEPTWWRRVVARVDPTARVFD